MTRLQIAALAMLLALTATVVAAQSSPPAPRQQRAMPAWDASTVTTIKGTVAQSREVGRVQLVTLMIKTAAGSQAILLAPETALDPTLAKLAPGTEVEVSGSKVKTTRSRREQEVTPWPGTGGRWPRGGRSRCRRALGRGSRTRWSAKESIPIFFLTFG
jgi:hypothetical protein